MNESLVSSLPAFKLGFWLRIAALNAVPSVAIALGWLQLWRFPAAIAAILCAVVLFAVVLTVCTKWVPALDDPKHSLSRALGRAVRIRLLMSIVSLVFIPTGYGMILVPDAWCGALSAWAVQMFSQWMGLGNAFKLSLANEGPGFHVIFILCLIQGILVCALFGSIWLLVVIRIQSADRKRAFGQHSSGSLVG